MSSLRGIRVLNVSHNILSGNIPDFLEDFNALLLLDLSFNNFKRTVPVGGIFKNATATSLIGNSNLCGGMPAFGLSTCPPDQSHRRKRLLLKILLPIVSAILLVILSPTCIYLCGSRKKEKASVPSFYENAKFVVSYKTILEPTKGFSPANLLGSGSFGTVYKGFLEEKGITVAIKVFDLRQHRASRSFEVECEALRNIRHRNLVKVLTACSGTDYHGNNFKALVYEYMVNGSLEDWLHPSYGSNEEPKGLNLLQRLNIAIDVACALEYLHHQTETQIIHCDIKPSNILLGGEATGHLSDFGVAKLLDQGPVIPKESSSIGIRGSIGYAPPEYSEGSQVSTSGDMYSYGVLLLEMFTGKRPTDDMLKDDLNLREFVRAALPEQVAEITDPVIFQADQEEAMTSSGRGRGRHSSSERRVRLIMEGLASIFRIGISCSFDSPRDRLNATHVVAQLSSIRRKLLPERRPFNLE